ncbi:hypothetical protein AC578_9273 [Pseudocercospora eumusae]|uniref:Uncharacterized protein n=1 Tax=Pseudocercospora eumusae TaxID=321146 RepID=A0A139HNH1_9PEZI|nr:hypothetical protein AC578_9273 [Pseudocercospora eumusae]
MGLSDSHSAARENPSQLGDPVSLKAETSDTDLDRPNTNHDKENSGRTSLKRMAEEKLKRNPSALGDPVSLKAETSDTEPTDQDRGAGSLSSGKPKM